MSDNEEERRARAWHDVTQFYQRKKVFHENKNLNFKMVNSFAEIASIWSMHDDMSAKPCENSKMITVNFTDL
jgi:hypothetical protein